MSDHYMEALQTGFWDELEKIAAKRENRSVGRTTHKGAKTKWVSQRKGSIGVHPSNLVKQSQVPALTRMLGKLTLPGLAAGTVVGVPMGFMGFQGIKDWQMGRQLRRMQHQR